MTRGGRVQGAAGRRGPRVKGAGRAESQRCGGRQEGGCHTRCRKLPGMRYRGLQGRDGPVCDRAHTPPPRRLALISSPGRHLHLFPLDSRLSFPVTHAAILPAVRPAVATPLLPPYYPPYRPPYCPHPCGRPPTRMKTEMDEPHDECREPVPVRSAETVLSSA